jgi:transposase-like protein
MDFTAARYNQPDAAREYLESLRWPKGPECPHCGGVERISRIEAQTVQKATPGNRSTVARAGLLFCGDCRTQFSVTVGTVFERSKIPLHKWVLATHLLCSSKKGMSAHQLHRMLGITYKTAWFMAHRIREAMKSEGGMMGGGGKIVEADETYYGPRSQRTRNGKIKGAKRGGGNKQKIFALVERDGSTRAFHVTDVNGATLKPILQAMVAKDSTLFTDSASHWTNMPEGTFAKHEMVNHMAKEYVRGEVHTNSIESFFGLLKRGIVGTYHHVSATHLQRYCEEFSFRHSHRVSLGVNDEQRAASLLKQVGGKRLTYRRTNAAA